ncbi:MAG: DUF4153 domain-containing protein [Dysgonamonadaceae bacterium]|jgi:hypothetical protein|nr:DUF4153 domain-containing protein [Dysgonamonadaceae bacterium]
MRKFFSLASLSKKFILLTERMPVSILLIVGLAVLAFISINIKDYDVSYRWWIFCSIALFISITAILWLEDRMKNVWLRNGLALGGVALWGIYCLLLPQDDSLLHFPDGLQIVVLACVFFFAIFFISFLAKNRDHAYWQFATETLFQMLIAACFGIVLFGGLCLAAASIEALFDVNMSSKVYSNLWIFCALLFSPLYFLTNIPGRQEKHQSEMALSKTLKIMGLYILTPLLVVYAVILYAYLIRIIATWELPNGWVSWLVSALAVGGLLVITIIYPLRMVENRWAERISRYAGIVILPLLVLMTVGIGRRINDYGISINRCYILLLNIWLYGIYIYLYFSRARHIKWILITPVVIVLLASVGPWKFSSITKRVLLSKIETILEGRQLILSDSASWLNELDPEKKLEIREALDYLADTYGKASIQPLFKDSIENKSMYVIFADLKLNHLKETEAEINSQWFSFYSETGSEFLDIKGYQSCIMFSLDKYYPKEHQHIDIKLDSTRLNIRIISDNRSVSFPIKDVALKQIDLSNNTEAAILLEASDNDNILTEAPVHRYLLAITKMTGNYYTEKDSLSINNLEGILFYK